MKQNSLRWQDLLSSYLAIVSVMMGCRENPMPMMGGKDGLMMGHGSKACPGGGARHPGDKDEAKGFSRRENSLTRSSGKRSAD